MDFSELGDLNPRMDAAGWEDLFELLGIWPITLNVSAHESWFLLWYHAADGEDRMLAAGSDVLAARTLDGLSSMLKELFPELPSETQTAAGRLITALKDSEIPAEVVTEFQLDRALKWSEGAVDSSSLSDAEEFSSIVDILRDWHLTLESLGRLGDWPVELDLGANFVSEVTLFQNESAVMIAGVLAEKRIAELLRQELGSLMAATQLR